MCKKAVESARNTAEGELEILIYVDDDDPRKDEYEEAIVGKPLWASQAIRYLMGIAKGDLIMYGSDDYSWKTKGWDRIFRERMPSHGYALLCPSDLPGQVRKGLQPCFTPKFGKEVMWPDIFKHFGADTWVGDIARRAGVLIHVKEILVEHKKVQDATSDRERQDGDASRAKTVLDKYEGERQRIAERIKWLCTTAAPQ